MVHSKLDYHIGYQLAIENSQKLLKIAEKAAEENEFGIACSLSVLSAEEALKAGFIIIQHYSLNVQITDFDNVFKVHKVKHKHIKDFFTAKQVIHDAYKKHFAEYDVFLDKQHSLPDDIRAKLKLELKSLFDLNSKTEGHDTTFIHLEDAFNWLENANNDKNNGFYVGIKNNDWLSPKSVSHEKFDVARKYTSILLDFVVEMEKSFIECPKEWLLKCSVEDTERGLETKIHV